MSLIVVIFVLAFFHEIVVAKYVQDITRRDMVYQDTISSASTYNDNIQQLIHGAPDSNIKPAFDGNFDLDTAHQFLYDYNNKQTPAGRVFNPYYTQPFSKYTQSYQPIYTPQFIKNSNFPQSYNLQVTQSTPNGIFSPIYHSAIMHPNPSYRINPVSGYVNHQQHNVQPQGGQNYLYVNGKIVAPNKFVHSTPYPGIIFHAAPHSFVSNVQYLPRTQKQNMNENTEKNVKQEESEEETEEQNENETEENLEEGTDGRDNSNYEKEADDENGNHHRQSNFHGEDDDHEKYEDDAEEEDEDRSSDYKQYVNRKYKKYDFSSPKKIVRKIVVPKEENKFMREVIRNTKFLSPFDEHYFAIEPKSDNARFSLLAELEDEMIESLQSKNLPFVHNEKLFKEQCYLSHDKK